MKLKTTYLIPAVLLITSVISGFFVYLNHRAIEEEDVRATSLFKMKLDLSRLQNILYNLVTEGNMPEARLNMSVMAMDGSVRKLILVDDKNTILISNRYSEEGDKAPSVSNYDVSAATSAIKSNIPVTRFIGGQRDLLVGYYPVVIDIVSKRSGVLYTEYSIKNALFYNNQKLRKEALFYSAVLLFSALIVAVFLYFFISRRLSILTKSAKALGQGEFDRPVKLKGNDEISNLSSVFEEMRLRIRDFIKGKEESEFNLRILNESLEERIAERTQSLAEAQQIAKVGSWYWDIQADIVIWSDETYRMFGYEKDEIDVTLEVFLSLVHPDDIELVKAEVEKALSSDSGYKIEHRIVLRDGSIKWLHGEGYVEHGEQDTDTVMRGIVQDITLKKDEQVKREALEMQLMQSQKMESIGQLTGGIAHDFNNMLASVLGFSELAQKISKGYHDERLQSYLEQINDAAERAASLVSQMLTFSRIKGDIHDIENISAVTLVNNSAKMLKPIIPSSIEFSVLNNVGDAVVDVNPLMIEQVIVNLSLNARDAIENEVGKINLSINRVSATNILCSSCGKSVPGNFISINVSDTGVGISQDVLNRVFDPFFTTKEVGKGTGMGLSMVHGIIHKHGGHIVIDNLQEEGVEFRILLPESECESLEEHGVVDGNVKNNIGKKGHILVVDDEESIVTYMRDILELEGYSVTSMSNGSDAEKYFKRNANTIDMVITDQTMPGMSGDELIKSILSVKPELPIILCSGYSEKVDHEKAMSLGVKAFLKKPINTSELRSQLETIFSKL